MVAAQLPPPLPPPLCGTLSGNVSTPNVEARIFSLLRVRLCGIGSKADGCTLAKHVPSALSNASASEFTSNTLRATVLLSRLCLDGMVELSPLLPQPLFDVLLCAIV
jgi:hypothetical protein